MSAKVFANGMEVSSKGSGNKSIAAVPDVCMSPPAPPAGPVPIPYPNTAVASDTTDGSKSVSIGGKEVHLKNKSSYKKSQGNEPATNNFGANIITHKITGAAKFASWSFNVKVEGQNVTRFMDLTTHNHANPGGGAVTSSIAAMNAAQAARLEENACAHLEQANEATREESTDKGALRVQSRDVVAHAVYTNPQGVRGVIRATNRGDVGKYDNSFAKGLLPAGLGKEGREPHLRKLKERGLVDGDGRVGSRVCGGGKFRYNSKAYTYPHHTSHAESRMLEDIFARHPQGGGRILLSIDWPNHPRGKNRRAPCANCHKLLCAAAACMEIRLCDEDNEPKALKC